MITRAPRRTHCFAIYFFVFAIMVASFFFSTHQVQAQSANGADVGARRAELERELAALEKEISAQQNLVNQKRGERVSLERDVAILDAEIKKAQLSIRARNLEIEKLGQEIVNKEGTIGSLNDKLVREKRSLAKLFRKSSQVDDYTLVEIVLGNKNISEFFEEVDNYDAIKVALRDSFREIEATKADTHEQKLVLEDRQESEVELRQLQELEKQKIETREAEKQRILQITKGEEALYQQVLATKQQTAAQIRAELFTLRGSAAIPFERALEYANAASAKTGVRPAFILGIIAEESRLGEFIGTGNWIEDMHPTRDRPVFEDITRRLGLDPNLMPVSKKPWYGWGGAMGPAQFIPSTWILYEERIAAAIGQNPPNPWDPRTAFMASGLLLMDNGADRGGYANERLAALRYFAGWTNAGNPAYAFYGDEVMALADKYQGLIDILAQS